jgi:hypothetical protein
MELELVPETQVTKVARTLEAEAPETTLETATLETATLETTTLETTTLETTTPGIPRAMPTATRITITTGTATGTTTADAAGDSGADLGVFTGQLVRFVHISGGNARIRNSRKGRREKR